MLRCAVGLTRTQDYKAGTLLTGQLKAKCISVLQAFVKNFQEVCSRFPFPCRKYEADVALKRRKQVSEDVLNAFMDPKRKIEPTIGVAVKQEAPAAAA